MNETQRPIDTGTLFWGLTLIGVGSIFLVDRLGLADLRHLIRTWWPLWVILMGVSKLLSGNRRGLRYRSRGRSWPWSALWVLAIGVWLQIVTLRLFGLTYGSSWPLLLIALGAVIVLRSLVEAIAPHFSAAEERDE